MECELFSPPTRLGGLHIIDCVNSAARSHNASVHATAILTELLRKVTSCDLDSHVNAVLNARHRDAVSRDASYNQLFDSLSGEFDVF